MKMRFLTPLLLCLCHGAVCQQTPPTAKPAAYTGCVTKLPNVDRNVLASGGRCMLLTGKVDATLVNHLVVLHGLRVEPVGMAPLTLQVDAIVEIKESCSDTCKLLPPGTRGINHEKPGSDGGPPGEVKQPPPPPAQ